LTVATSNTFLSTLQVGGSSASQSVVTYRLAPGAEVPLCYLINTGEYCAEVVPQLEAMIKQKISSNLVEKVDLSSEVDAYMDLVAHALKVRTSAHNTGTWICTVSTYAHTHKTC
jgi:hypothetical protein